MDNIADNGNENRTANVSINIRRWYCLKVATLFSCLYWRSVIVEKEMGDMQTFTKAERRVLSLPGYVLLVIILALVLMIGGMFYLLSSSGNEPVSSSRPSGVRCVPAPIVQAPISPPHAQPGTPLKPLCPAGYVPQPDGHVAPKGIPRP
jgi:hypothetical protein